MLRRVTIVGAMLALFVCLFMLLGTFGMPVRTAYAQACDPSGSVDGSAQPTTVLPGQTVTFTATNFTANEEVSFWFTTPSGVVAGTAAPLCCASPDGVVRFAPAALPSAFYEDPGKWALTVQGSTSNHTSVIYFCVLTSQPATATPPPPAATATATTAAASPTAAVTAAPTEPGVIATPTTAAATPVPVATEVPFETPTPVLPGMPTTGQGQTADPSFLVWVGLLGLALLVAGLGVRRRTADR
jgi:MYXO-CTERM domain-containing protein